MYLKVLNTVSQICENGKVLVPGDVFEVAKERGEMLLSLSHQIVAEVTDSEIEAVRKVAETLPTAPDVVNAVLPKKKIKK
jgi:hypothetical protein